MLSHHLDIRARKGCGEGFVPTWSESAARRRAGGEGVGGAGLYEPPTQPLRISRRADAVEPMVLRSAAHVRLPLDRELEMWQQPGPEEQR